MSRHQVIGFIGLGVMGEPICRNLVKKSGARVVAFDIATEPLQRLRAEGAEVGRSVADVVRQSELVFLCLPSAKHVRQVFEGDGILENVGKGQVVVDLGTSSVSQTRDFAGRLQAKGASWADAPIARTRQAAQDGTLSVMVGGAVELYRGIEPVIRCFATDVTHCGDVGAGQVTKILNNMVLFETVQPIFPSSRNKSTRADCRSRPCNKAHDVGPAWHRLLSGQSGERWQAVRRLGKCPLAEAKRDRPVASDAAVPRRSKMKALADETPLAGRSRLE